MKKGKGKANYRENDVEEAAVSLVTLQGGMGGNTRAAAALP